MTIYYLSASGNSLYAAKLLKKRLEADGREVRLLSMQEAIKEDALHPEGEVGLVMPLHFFGIPLFAAKFLELLDLRKVSYSFVLMTSGWHYWSCAMHLLREIFRKKGGELSAGFYADYLSIYVMLNDIPKGERKEKKLQKGIRLTERAAEFIRRQERHFDREYMVYIARKFYAYVVRNQKNLDKDFWVRPSCTGCGICSKICQADNIRLEDGRPVFWHNCTQCLACMHACPQRAIEYGKKTEKCQRYRHPEIQLSELLKK